MIEDVVKKVKSLLQTYLPAALDVVEARWVVEGDPITLDDVPNANYFLARMDMRNWHSYPSVFVLGERTPGVNRITATRRLTHNLAVIISLEDRGPNPGRLQKKIWRYVEAIEDVLNNDPTLGNKVITSTITMHDYTGNMIKDTTTMTHDGALLIEALEDISM